MTSPRMRNRNKRRKSRDSLGQPDENDEQSTLMLNGEGEEDSDEERRRGWGDMIMNRREAKDKEELSRSEDWGVNFCESEV